MADSESKQFGDRYLGLLDDELGKKAPFYKNSLFVGAGSGTKDAWRRGTADANSLIDSGGYTDPMRDAMSSFGNIGTGYGAAGDRSRSMLNPLYGGYGDAISGSDSALGDIGNDYDAFGANGGLNGQQRNVMTGLSGLGGKYAGLGGLTSGQQGNLNATNNVAGGFGGLTANGGLSSDQIAAMGKTSGLGDAYGGLSDAYDQDAPGYARMRQGLLDDAAQNVGSGFTASGRFGGGSYINDATEASLNAIAPLDYQNYTNSVNNKYRSLDSQKGIQDTLFGQGQQGINNTISGLSGQLGAAGQAFGMGQQGRDNSMSSLDAQRGVYGDTFNMGQTGRNNELAALSGRTGVANSMFGNRMSGLAGQAGIANSMFGNDMAALGGQAGAASSLFGMGQAGIDNRRGAIDSLLGYGSARDADRQGKRLGDADRYDRKHNAGLDRLLKVGAGFGDPIGAANQPPWWQQALGYVAGNAGRAVSEISR